MLWEKATFKVCDGVIDCPDGSDEGNNCPRSETQDGSQSNFSSVTLSDEIKEMMKNNHSQGNVIYLWLFSLQNFQSALVL